jgi:hypothetical protein
MSPGNTTQIKRTFDRRGARAMRLEARPPARFSSLLSPKNTQIHPLAYAKTHNLVVLKNTTAV